MKSHFTDREVHALAGEVWCDSWQRSGSYSSTHWRTRGMRCSLACLTLKSIGGENVSLQMCRYGHHSIPPTGDPAVHRKRLALKKMLPIKHQGWTWYAVSAW